MKKIISALLAPIVGLSMLVSPVSAGSLHRVIASGETNAYRFNVVATQGLETGRNYAQITIKESGETFAGPVEFIGFFDEDGDANIAGMHVDASTDGHLYTMTILLIEAGYQSGTQVLEKGLVGVTICSDWCDVYQTQEDTLVTKGRVKIK